MSSQKKRLPGEGLKKTETLTLRLSPRSKHLIDIMSRKQRRAMAAVVEHALELAATAEESELADSTWALAAEDRVSNLYRKARHLCTFEEEQLFQRSTEINSAKGG